MKKEHILIVDDEEDILELLRFNLVREGYEISEAKSGEEALTIANQKLPDLIILDLMLTGMDGLEVTRRLKNTSKTRQIPIIMLSAKGEEADIVTGLELGADDYITKPFSPRIVVARVRAAFRRQAPEADEGQEVLSFGELSIHPGMHTVRIKDVPLQLTFTEFQILYLLAANPGWVFTRSRIVDQVRGDNHAVTDRSVDVQIVGLRKKLGDLADHIETVRGVGYRFKKSI